jgi:fatty-acyl-CoA synthase/long-chain acyl-CoA synthetase
VIDDRPDESVQRWTFQELEALSNRLANALRASGVRTHDRIAWCGRNSISVLAFVHAARKLSATSVALNYRFTSEEAAHVLRDSDAVALWIDAEFAEHFAAVTPRAPRLRTTVVYDGDPAAGQLRAEDFLATGSDDPPAAAEGDPGPALTMHYTSGTTGRPKGAIRRTTGRDDQEEELPNVLDLIGYGPGDVYLTTGPLYHSGPGDMATLSTMLGNTIVIQRRFDAEDWLHLVDTYHVSSIYAAPTPIRRVCRLPAEVKARYDTSSIRLAMAGAAPWSYALKLAYLEDFPEDSLWEMYGSTELGLNTLLEPRYQRTKPGSCGKPIRGVEIALFDDDGERITEPMQPGELYVKSPLVFDQYHKQEEQTRSNRRGDFATVGDVAYFDEEGFYYICDRKLDMIISGGMNIYPAEIEAALELHPDVDEAAVFGIPSDEWGESVHAVVVPRSSREPSDADLEAHLRKQLAGYKIPRSFEREDALPRNEAGKILKRSLREPWWKDRERRV